MSFTLPVIPKNDKTMFGELSTTNMTPVIQISANHGITNNVFTTSVGGTTTVVNEMFTCQTGATSTGIAVISSNNEIPYRAGQGIRSIESAVFTPPVANSIQFTGLFTSESFIGFGYNGLDFGVVIAYGGKLELQTLTVNSGATGAETATVTIDGVAHSIPLSSGTSNLNAYEVATYLQTNEPRYNFTSNGNVVNCLAKLPDFGTGAFTFSSATATGAFLEITASQLPTHEWVNQVDWNVDTVIIDPTLGNVYRVDYAYTGFDGAKFYVKDPVTMEFVLVHKWPFNNKYSAPLVKSPIFRAGWFARNEGNTTNLTVSGGSASAFNEGEIVYGTKPMGVCHIQTISSGADYNILSFRNRLDMNGKANRSNVIPFDLDLSTESTKTTVFKIYINATVATGNLLTFSYLNSLKELGEIATDNIEIISGELVGCFSGTSDKTVNLENLLGIIDPNKQITITANIASGAAADVTASMNFKEDL